MVARIVVVSCAIGDGVWLRMGERWVRASGKKRGADSEFNEGTLSVEVCGR